MTRKLIAGFGIILALLFTMAATQVGTQQLGLGTNNDGPGYTFFLSGSTYYARNNTTGIIDYSGSDAGPVIRSAIANNSSVCGNLIFEYPGTAGYVINTLVLDSADGFYKAIEFPASAASASYKCHWTVTGDSWPTMTDESPITTIQNNGIIFHISATAVSSVSSSVMIEGFGVQPDSTYLFGPALTFRNISVRFPTNQRATGGEFAIDPYNAYSLEYDHVLAEFDILEQSLAFPASPTLGLYGLGTTASSHTENDFKDAFAVGYNVCLDVASEHLVMQNSGETSVITQSTTESTPIQGDKSIIPLHGRVPFAKARRTA